MKGLAKCEGSPLANVLPLFCPSRCKRFFATCGFIAIARKRCGKMSQNVRQRRPFVVKRSSSRLGRPRQHVGIARKAVASGPMLCFEPSATAHGADGCDAICHRSPVGLVSAIRAAANHPQGRLLPELLALLPKIFVCSALRRARNVAVRLARGRPSISALRSMTAS